jgi:AraC-like DNA-binding protein
MAVSTTLILIELVLMAFVVLLLYTEEQKVATRSYVLAIIGLLVFAQFPPLLIALFKIRKLSFIGFLPFRHWVFLAGPFLCFYTRRCMGKSFAAKDLLHLLPFVFWYASYLLIPEKSLHGTMVKSLYGMTSIASLVFYCLFILRDIRKFKMSIRDRFSYTSVFMELSWLSSILKTLLGIVLCLTLLVSFLPKLFPSFVLQGKPLLAKGLDPEFVRVFHGAAILAFSFVFSFFALKQNRFHTEFLVFEKTFKPLVLLPEREAEIVKEQDNQNFTTLLAYMERAKPYLENTLSLQTLSESVGIPRNELSHIINTEAKENFFQFVNGYRAREFLSAIEENRYPDYTLLGIALECGFNSKATFNTAVKQKLGKTPSQIVKDQKIGMTL